jgi:hypothetical protein
MGVTWTVCEATSAPGLAAALRRLVDNPDLLQGLTERGGRPAHQADCGGRPRVGGAYAELYRRVPARVTA